MTPEEVWYHIKPKVSFLEVFGSDAWTFIPDGQHKVMEKKSLWLIFISYCEDVKGY